jgi:general stress protein 26
MSTQTHDPAELQQRLWKEIGKARYGMLGLVGRAPARHFQPMTAFCEPETEQIWFFTRNDTDLAWDIGDGSDAMFVVQAKDQGFQACVGGRLTQQRDPARIEKYWGPIVAAWYPDGKDDQRLTLLRFDLRDAQLWLSETNALAFFFQIAKANITHAEPDVGESAAVELSGGAAR